MDKVTFIIADNNDLTRLGLRTIIQEQFKPAEVNFAYNKLELHKSLIEDSKSVILIDLEGFDTQNIDDIIAISNCFPDSKWLIVAPTADESFLLRLTASFSKANFVLKSNDYDMIATAIFNTLEGKKSYCSEALEIIMDGYSRKKYISQKSSLLTTTELELLQLFAQGKTAREIADSRCLSHHTINTHRKNIFRKLEVTNIQELIKYALKNGLVDLTEYYI